MTEDLRLVPTDVPEIDTEHVLQLQILDTIENALRNGRRHEALDLTKKLRDFTEAHFAGEQILMRFHSYPDYWTHEREHGFLLDDLARIIGRLERQDDADLAAEAGSLRRWLLSHIRTADQAFAVYLRNAPASASVAAPGAEPDRREPN